MLAVFRHGWWEVVVGVLIVRVVVIIRLTAVSARRNARLAVVKLIIVESNIGKSGLWQGIMLEFAFLILQMREVTSSLLSRIFLELL